MSVTVVTNYKSVAFSDGHLGHLQHLAIVNCATMNIGVHRFFWIAWMELESIMLGKVGQVVKDKYHMISPLTGT